jgi:hypothetical protein
MFEKYVSGSCWLTRRVPDLVELMTVHDSQLN